MDGTNRIDGKEESGGKEKNARAVVCRGFAQGEPTAVNVLAVSIVLPSARTSGEWLKPCVAKTRLVCQTKKQRMECYLFVGF